ncbi:MAG: preprotein translocase subunit SecG [Chloroflexota bacterium]
MAPYLNIAQIIISAALILVVLLQAKGTGFSGALSTEGSIFSTRRGLEKTLFQITIVLAALFAIVSIASVLAAKGGSA